MRQHRVGVFVFTPDAFGNPIRHPVLGRCLRRLSQKRYASRERREPMSAKETNPFNFTKNPNTQWILELIGWLVCVILPINIALRIGDYAHEYAPRWVQWIVVLIMFGALFFWSISWYGYGVSRVNPKIPRSDAERESWFRTDFLDSPSNFLDPSLKWRITGIESSPLRADAASISIDDGQGCILVLECNLQTKRLSGCRAYPKQELPQETIPTDRSSVKPDKITESLNSLINKVTKAKGDHSGGSR
jgi:hypothetical protein